MKNRSGILKNGKTILLFVCAIFVIIGIFIGEMNFQSLATDSGFDTSYGGGSSGGGGGHSHSSHSSSGGGSSAQADLLDTIFFVSFLIGIAGTVVAIIKEKYLLQKVFAVTSLSGFMFLIIKYFLLAPSLALKVLFAFPLIGLWGYLVWNIIKTFDEMEKSDKLDKILSGRVSPEDREILDKGYQIYLDVQKAWMDFDYEKMRKLVTDEMFQMYQSQLQTLEIKEEKNVMKDFNRKQSVLLSRKTEKGITTTELLLKVSFYDYIVNKDHKIVRGTNERKVVMTYKLTFVSSTNVTKCPHCGAKLEKDNTICSYCHTKILSPLGEMKLAKKEVLRQG